ncbi:MAG: hypothetical protein NVS9B4_12600 [Candidatus Acidiferrum sp.]
MNLRILTLVTAGMLMATPTWGDEVSFKDFSDLISDSGFSLTVKHLTGEGEALDDKDEGESDVSKDLEVEFDASKLELEIESHKAGGDESFIIDFAPKPTREGKDTEDASAKFEDDAGILVTGTPRTEDTPKTPVAAPEPSEAGLLFGGLVGLAALGLAFRRKGKASFRERMAF